jgi:hypothetical protein
MHGIIEDVAFLEEWFYENEICFIMPYIETHFAEVSYNHQYWFMKEHLFFTKTIIENEKLTDEEKRNELVESVRRGKSKIVMVVGARGSGKTATALWLAEQVREKGGQKVIYYVGKPECAEYYPDWIKFVNDLDHLPENSFALIDESAIKYSSRRSMKNENVELSEKLVILRHQNITLVLITQNISMIEINIDRLADIIIYKMGTSYGIRKKKGDVLNKFWEEKMITLERLKPRNKDQVMVEYLTGSYSLLRSLTNPLPSFWDEERISKSFRGYGKDRLEKETKAIQTKTNKEVIYI